MRSFGNKTKKMHCRISKKYHKEKDTIFPEKYGQKIGIMTIKRLQDNMEKIPTRILKQIPIKIFKS